MISLPTLSITAVKQQVALVRVDFNVPLEGKQVVDDQRIRAALPTLSFLKEHGAKIVLMSHLGRPDGQPNDKYSLAPVADYLQNNLKMPVRFVTDCVGEAVRQASAQLAYGEMLLLENLRFHAAEEKNDPTFARSLVADTGASVFINEAFSASHRAHASVVGVAELLPSYAGFNLAAEVKILQEMLDKAKRPFVAVLGGAKIDDKIEAVRNLTKVADLVLVGGGVANAFLKAAGLEVHKSFMGSDAAANIKIAQEILAEHGIERTMIKSDDDKHTLPLPKVVLPVDVLAATDATVTHKEAVQTLALLRNVADTPDDLDLQYLDLGPATIKLYQYLLSSAATIFWNGPLGVCENPLFAKASHQLAKHIAAQSTQRSAVSIVGGGETGAVISTTGLQNHFTHVSTAGGAALEFIGGTALPGIEVLRRHSKSNS